MWIRLLPVYDAQSLLETQSHSAVSAVEYHVPLALCTGKVGLRTLTDNMSPFQLVHAANGDLKDLSDGRQTQTYRHRQILPVEGVQAP